MEQLLLDDETGRPEFITVNTGLFGTKDTYVPVTDATLDGDRLTVPFSKEHVKDAPNVDTADGHLDRSDEERLYQYYDLQYPSHSDADAGHHTTTTGTTTTGTPAETTTGMTGRTTDGSADRDNDTHRAVLRRRTYRGGTTPPARPPTTP